MTNKLQHYIQLAGQTAAQVTKKCKELGQVLKHSIPCVPLSVPRLAPDPCSKTSSYGMCFIRVMESVLLMLIAGAIRGCAMCLTSKIR